MSKLRLIYQFTSPSGKSYIGQTNNLSRRINSHKHTSRCSAFSDAIKKYGFDKFTLTIIKDNLTIDEANYWEALYIKELNTVSPNGYNLRTGGDNSLVSEETRKKMSVAFKGRISNRKGCRLTDDTREKLCIARNKRKNKPCSEDTKNKISQSNKGRRFTEEHKLKLSAAQERVALQNSRMIIEVTTNTKFNRLINIRDYYKIGLSTVYLALRTGNPVKYGNAAGKIFKYCDEPDAA